MKFRCRFVLCLLVLSTLDSVIGTTNRDCKAIPEPLLEEILGPAFNGRYMSINKPQAKQDSSPKEGDKKRASIDSGRAFAVDDTYMDQLHDRPAWELRNHVAVEASNLYLGRAKRSASYLQEWHCASKVIWMDLGPDYFPRYLRTVECVTKNCWFHIYNCRPRSFTVKLLRRKRNKCVQTHPGYKLGIVGLPRELAELWVWEERALTFCCDCKL